MVWVEIIGALFALLYLWLEIHQRPAMWAVGIISSLFYVAIFYAGKFYADMGLNGYFVLASVYGWRRWKYPYPAKRRPMKEPLPVSRTRPRIALVLTGIMGALWYVLYAVLHYGTDSPIPAGDSFTTAASIVATWMLANKLIEHWGIWFTVNVVSTALYFHRGLYPTAVLYIIYAAASVFGYLKWRKDILSNEEKRI